MYYVTEIAACLLAYEQILLTPPWGDEPTVHVTKLRELLSKHYASLSPDEFTLLREIMALHAELKARMPSNVIPDECTRPVGTGPGWVFQVQTLPAIDKLMKLLRQGMDDNERSQLACEFPAGKLPEDVTDVINMTYVEVLKDYANGCYVSAIALCGKVLETCLSALYMKVSGKNPDEEKLGPDALVNRLKNAGYEFHSATKNQMAVISTHRHKAIHGSIVIPTRDEARGVISLTKDVMLKAASK